ncbi:hypothetical protein HK404_37500, partial [Myxococcus xanthus]|nr:hypothetical protein [Myxococcus xanthus]
PKGTTLSLERRRELVRLAQQYRFLILEDDPYGEQAVQPACGWSARGTRPTVTATKCAGWHLLGRTHHGGQPPVRQRSRGSSGRMAVRRRSPTSVPADLGGDALPAPQEFHFDAVTVTADLELDKLNDEELFAGGT